MKKRDSKIAHSIDVFRCPSKMDKMDKQMDKMDKRTFKLFSYLCTRIIKELADLGSGSSVQRIQITSFQVSALHRKLTEHLN